MFHGTKAERALRHRHLTGLLRLSLLGLVISTITSIEAGSGDIGWRIWTSALWVSLSCAILIVAAGRSGA